MRTINYYSYEELLAAAIAPDATQEDVDALGEWCERFGHFCFNGYCWDVSSPDEPTGTRSLHPIYNFELPDAPVVGYELR